jgi:hypothetical protein
MVSVYFLYRQAATDTQYGNQRVNTLLIAMSPARAGEYNIRAIISNNSSAEVEKREAICLRNRNGTCSLFQHTAA